MLFKGVIMHLDSVIMFMDGVDMFFEGVDIHLEDVNMYLEGGWKIVLVQFQTTKVFWWPSYYKATLQKNCQLRSARNTWEEHDWLLNSIVTSE